MRTPKTVMSDVALADAVMSELEWDTRVRAAGIRVSAKEGAVRLSGHVHSYPQKVAAVRAAERVQGVRAVADDLDVTLPSGLVRDDGKIAAEIARERSSTTSIPDSVVVEVTKGHVTLHGEVQRNYQREDAERTIRHLKGVRGVSNHIAVKPPADAGANAVDVGRRIEDAIERMADLDAHSISVATTDDTVRLHGTVHSVAERRLAQRAAESAPGVTRVENDLVVAP